MNRKFGIFVMIVLGMILSGCSSEGIYTLKVVGSGKLTIPSGSSLTADVIVLEGEVEIEEGAVLEGSLYQLLGKAVIDGRLKGDLTQWSGDLRMGPEAVITGNLSLSGETFQQAEGAVIEGEVLRSEVEVAPREWFTGTLPQQLLWSGVQVLLISGAAWLAGGVFPVGVARVRSALQEHSLVSLSMGILVGLVGITLLVQMAFTILLIPVTFLGLFLLGAAVVFGWIALGEILGEKAAALINRRWSAQQERIFGTALLQVLLMLLNLVPLLGGPLALGVSVVSLGAVFLTRFGSRQFVPAQQLS